ncbi:MAG: mechanosensitive ion channel family protein [Asticcacaulis sp.]
MILTLGFVAIMNRLGVATASFITVLGAASLSIGLALQGTLGNVASGLMLLFTKPYRIGDSVHVGEISGTVHRLGVFSTEIDSGDNVRVYVPNSKVFSSEICNLSANGALKIEVRVDVGYETDLKAALDLLLDVAKAQPDRLATHEPVTSLVEFAASGITARVWIWVLPAAAVSARTAVDDRYPAGAGWGRDHHPLSAPGFACQASELIADAERHHRPGLALVEVVLQAFTLLLKLRLIGRVVRQGAVGGERYVGMTLEIGAGFEIDRHPGRPSESPQPRPR